MKNPTILGVIGLGFLDQVPTLPFLTLLLALFFERVCIPRVPPNPSSYRGFGVRSRACSGLLQVAGLGFRECL